MSRTEIRQEIKDEQEATEREAARAKRAPSTPPPPLPVFEPQAVDGFVQALLARGKAVPGDIGFPSLPPPFKPAVGTVLTLRQVNAMGDLDTAYFLATIYSSEQKVQNYFRQMYFALRRELGAPQINP
jgi:hypothetical protein